MNIEEENSKNPLSKEFLLNNKDLDSFSFNMDVVEENYSKLYSNFDIKERNRDFWDALNNSAKNFSSPNKLNKLHHILNYKDYRLKSNGKQDNLNLSSFKKNKRGRNNKKINLNIINMNIINTNNTNNNKTYELNLDENNVYNRLYNRGFYIKNKILIQKIKNDEAFSKTMSNFNMNLKSKKILLNKKQSKINGRNEINKSQYYYQEEETFKPNINKNSIRIFKRLQKEKNFSNKKKTNYSFYDEKSKLNKIKYDIFKNDYANLYNYFNKIQYYKPNKKIIKTKSQKNITFQKINIESIKNKNNIKSNQYIKKINPNNLYEKHKMWEKLKDEKIEKMKKIKENMELCENRKELDLPGKNNYEKYKNTIAKIFSPKVKNITYASLQKKNNTNLYNLFKKDNENNKEKEIHKNNKIRLEKYHRQNLKFVNNDGKELTLFESYLKNDENLINNMNKYNPNYSQFTSLVKERKNNIKINNNKGKFLTKNNKIKINKNSFEYKLKHIKNAFKNKNKK